MKFSLVTIASEAGNAYYVQPFRGCEHGGIHALASFLRHAQHTVQVIDGAALSLSLSEVLARLTGFNADVVGFSPTLTSMREVLKLVDAVKQWPFPPTVIMGGHHATLCAGDILSSEPSVDIVFYGEAENSLLDLLSRLKTQDRIDNIKGTVCHRDGRLQYNVPGTVIKDLDQLPHYDRDALCELKENHPIVGTTIQSSRGCPYECTFCTSPVFYQNGPKYRKHSPRYIADEMERICTQP